VRTRAAGASAVGAAPRAPFSSSAGLHVCERHRWQQRLGRQRPSASRTPRRFPCAADPPATTARRRPGPRQGRGGGVGASVAGRARAPNRLWRVCRRPGAAHPRRHAASIGASGAVPGARGWGGHWGMAKTHSQGRDLNRVCARAAPRPPATAQRCVLEAARGLEGMADWGYARRREETACAPARRARACRGRQGTTVLPTPPPAVAPDPAADSPTWRGWSEDRLLRDRL